MPAFCIFDRPTNIQAMKKNYLIIAFLFALNVLNSQTFEWLKTPTIDFNTSPDMVTYTSASDGQGNTFVCGFKDTPFSYNRVQGNLSLIKYDSNGNELFSKTLTGDLHAHKLQTDSEGNVYAAITFLTNISIGTFIHSQPLFVENPVLVKFNANGDYLWHKMIPGEFTNHFTSIAMDTNQNLYIGYDDYNNSIIEKIDTTNGATLQTITQTQVNLVSSISVDNEGNIYAAGSCADLNADFNGTDAPAPHVYTVYVVKYNPNGQMQWVKYIEDITCPSPIVKAKSPNEVYFSSQLFDSFAFDNITPEGPVDGFADFFLSKLNASGQFQWVREVPGIGSADVGNSNFLDVDSNGNIYLAGNTRFTIEWNTTVVTDTNGPNYELLVVKYNPSGEVIWAKTAGGTSYDQSHGVSLLPDASVIIIGIIRGDAIFEPIQHTSTTVNYYPFVAKMNQSTLSLPETSIGTVTVYPNPSKETVTISTINYTGVGVFYNLLGQKMKSIAITANETSVDISEMALGTYFLKIENQVVKVVKQ